MSWCQRLDGRILSTFSMMKLRGAKSVLRNCSHNKGKGGQKEKKWEREREKESGKMSDHIHGKILPPSPPPFLKKKKKRSHTPVTSKSLSFEQRFKGCWLQP